MADQKTTALTANTTPALADIMYLVDDPGGSAASQKITLQNLRRQLFPYGVCGGRLTLTTATPVTTADVTGGTHVYWTPYAGGFGCGQIGLYDGSSGWDVLNFTEIDTDIAAFTASKPYDFFGYNNSGALAIETVIWTNTTTRATALTYQDGILVKTGATTRRYLGTIYVNSSGGQTDDSELKRFVWNYYNRLPRKLKKYEGTSHSYTTGTWRSWNNDATVRVELIIGVLEEPVVANCYSDLETAYVCLGDNSTSVPATSAVKNLGTALIGASVTDRLYLAVGYHYVQGLEYGASGSTQAAIVIDCEVSG